jgi:hypothetical protein
MTIVIAANSLPRERGFMNAKPNTVDQSQNQHEESTYALLIRSEEKSRNVIEMAIYPVLILGAVIAISRLRRLRRRTSDAASSSTFGNQRIEKSSELAETW